jgi:hypothetical protein
MCHMGTPLVQCSAGHTGPRTVSWHRCWSFTEPARSWGYSVSSIWSGHGRSLVLPARECEVAEGKTEMIPLDLVELQMSAITRYAPIGGTTGGIVSEATKLMTGILSVCLAGGLQ